MRQICLALIIILAVSPSYRCQDEASLLGLRGHVHTVLTENFSSKAGVSRESLNSSFDIYDSRGYQLEGYLYKPDGSLWAHTIISRDGEKIFRSETTGTVPFESFSTQNIFDAHGNVIETDTYDADGTLSKKVTVGEVIEDAAEEGPAHDSAREQGAQASSEAISMASHRTQTSDAQGRLIEAIDDSNSKHIRCTYSYDEAGRPSGQINYDAAGKVVEESSTEYRTDSTGNWVEKTTIVWDTTSDPMKPKIVETSLRTINYYLFPPGPAKS